MESKIICWDLIAASVTFFLLTNQTLRSHVMDHSSTLRPKGANFDMYSGRKPLTYSSSSLKAVYLQLDCYPIKGWFQACLDPAAFWCFGRGAAHSQRVTKPWHSINLEGNDLLLLLLLSLLLLIFLLLLLLTQHKLGGEWPALLLSWGATFNSSKFPLFTTGTTNTEVDCFGYVSQSTFSFLPETNFF